MFAVHPSTLVSPTITPPQAVLKARGYYALVADVSRYKDPSDKDLELVLGVLMAHGKLLRGALGPGAIPRLLAKASEGGLEGAAAEAVAIVAERDAAAAAERAKAAEAEVAARAAAAAEAEDTAAAQAQAKQKRAALAVVVAAPPPPVVVVVPSTVGGGGPKSARGRGANAAQEKRTAAASANGVANGNGAHSNGLSNGHSNGHSNGRANGRANGHSNGNGHAAAPATETEAEEGGNAHRWYDADKPAEASFDGDTGGPVRNSGSGVAPQYYPSAMNVTRPQAAQLQPRGRSLDPGSDSGSPLASPLAPPLASPLASHAEEAAPAMETPEAPAEPVLEWACVGAVRGCASAVISLCGLDGGLSVSASAADPTIRLWSRTSLIGSCQSANPPQSQKSLSSSGTDAPPPPATALASLGGSRFAVGFSDGTVCVFDAAVVSAMAAAGTAAGRVPVVDRLEGHTAPVRSIAQLTGGRLATGSADGEIRLWEAHECVDILTAHHSSVDALAAVHCRTLAAPEGELLLSVSAGAPGAAPGAPAGSPGSSEGPTGKLWDAARGVFLADVPYDKSFGATLATLPGSARVVAAWAGCALRVYDAKAGSWGPMIGGHDAPAVAVAGVSREIAASASWDKTVRVWRIDAAGAGACERVLRGHADCLFALAALPGGRLLASGGQDRVVRVWEGAEAEAEAAGSTAAA